MDRGKTLEFLRGMKFMQRKEEARRREELQAQQDEAVRRQVAASTSGDGETDGTPGADRDEVSHGRGPTIIVLNKALAGSSRTTVAFRKRFSGTVAPRKFVTPAENAMDVFREVGENGEEDAWLLAADATAAVVRGSDAVDDGADDAGDMRASSSRRFVVPGSVRAPPMPKQLVKKISDDRVKRQRERDEDDDAAYSDPRMRF